MSFTPANELERVLVEAVHDPGARPRFYQLLVESELCVLTPYKKNPPGQRVAGQDEIVQFCHWSDGKRDIIPIFSSRERMREALAKMSQQYSFMAMPGRNLFEALAGGQLAAVLNANCACNKEFLLEEIKNVASGKLSELPKEVVMEKGQEILLGQPADYPHALVSALKTFFLTAPIVRAAYLAQVAEPRSNVPPHPMIALDLVEHSQDLIQQAVVVAREACGPGQIIDFVVLGSGGKLDYFKTIKPFYERPAPPPGEPKGTPPAGTPPFWKKLFGR
jgi:hypothetical protein